MADGDAGGDVAWIVHELAQAFNPYGMRRLRQLARMAGGGL